MQLSPTFSGHQRKLFIKSFPFRGKGPANPGEADVALFCHAEQLLPYPVAVSTVQCGV